MYKTLILRIVLYGCDARSLEFREECRLRVFENWILRRIFGLKKDKSEECRRLHNEELHSLYCPLNTVMVIPDSNTRTV